MGKRFNVVVARDDGVVEFHAMKEWLRRNPNHLPMPNDASSKTSRQLLGLLKRQGWRADELEDEVRLFVPGSAPAQAIQAVLGESETDDEVSDAALAFGLEAQLRDFIAHNIRNIPVGGRTLSLYSDAAGRSGVEFPTDVGPIDILAVDDAVHFVVFELKLNRGPDRALGQLARYMGWVRAHLSPSADVSGVIVARSIDERLRYAVAVVPRVTLLEYDVSFQVREAPPVVLSAIVADTVADD
jgi:RecB family endonuclease NucS